MTIEHIVLPGGGPIGILVYGALKRLNKINFWNIDNIKSIHCTSIGGLIGIITILNLDWDWMDDFLIKRPWNKIIDLNNINYIELISEKGILDTNIAKNIIEPLLKAKGLDPEITLAEFYNFSKITIYFYSTNINSLLLDEYEISYKTHPELKLYEALYSSMNVPFMFKPYFIDDKCLIDGGLVNNNPIKSCINSNTKNDKNDNILFFTNCNENVKSLLQKDSNIFDLLLLMLSKMAITIMCKNSEFEKNNFVKNTIKCKINNGSLNIEYWLNVLNNQSEREKLLENGINIANEFISNNLIKLDDISINENKNLDLSNNEIV